MNLSAKCLCLAFLNSFFPWKGRPQEKRKAFRLCPEGFCCSGRGPGCEWHGLLYHQRKLKESQFFPFLLILYWIHLFGWTRKSHRSLLCAVLWGLDFIPDLKPQKNLNIASAQDLAEWRFIYNPIFTISDTQCFRVGFCSSSVQSLT